MITSSRYGFSDFTETGYCHLHFLFHADVLAAVAFLSATGANPGLQGCDVITGAVVPSAGGAVTQPLQLAAPMVPVHGHVC